MEPKETVRAGTFECYVVVHSAFSVTQAPWFLPLSGIGHGPSENNISAWINAYFMVYLFILWYTVLLSVRN